MPGRSSQQPEQNTPGKQDSSVSQQGAAAAPPAVQPLPGYETAEDAAMAIFRGQHELSGTREGLLYVERWRASTVGRLENFDAVMEQRAARRLAREKGNIQAG